MARTISQLTAGAKIYIDEFENGSAVHTPYIYLGLDESGNARVLRELAAVAMPMNESGIVSYDGCDADLWLEDAESGFLSRFDAATRDALQSTSILYVDYTKSADGTAQVLGIARRCFLLSYSEEGYGNDPAGSEGRSYLAALQSYTGKTGNAARVTFQKSGAVAIAWMRSAASSALFRFVYSPGSAGSGGSRANNWLRPALSFAPTTPVSDEGAESIFLLPDGRRMSWDINATMSLGKTAQRPASCKLMIPHDSFTALAVQVCNNYGDDAPTWIDCADGGEAPFGMVKTAQDWELGVKLHAEAAAPNHTIGEPAMIVAFGS